MSEDIPGNMDESCSDTATSWNCNTLGCFTLHESGIVLIVPPLYGAPRSRDELCSITRHHARSQIGDGNCGK
jgi:hypothetical protein